MSKRGRFAGVDTVAQQHDSDKVDPGLFVLGLPSTLFRDDDVARGIDEERHLVPWNGDHSTMVDRFDVRLLLDDLRHFDAPSFGAAAYRAGEPPEVEVERYADLDPELEWQLTHPLQRPQGAHDSPSSSSTSTSSSGTSSGSSSSGSHTSSSSGGSHDSSSQSDSGSDSDTDQARGHRRHTADQPQGGAYAAVALNYGSTEEQQGVNEHEEEPGFRPPFESLPEHLQLPGALPQNSKLDKVVRETARFVRKGGGQVEVLLRVKQAGNPTFGFLHPGHRLHPYYTWLVKSNPQEVCSPQAPAPPQTSTLARQASTLSDPAKGSDVFSLLQSYGVSESSQGSGGHSAPGSPTSSSSSPQRGDTATVLEDADTATQGGSAHNEQTSGRAEGDAGSEGAGRQQEASQAAAPDGTGSTPEGPALQAADVMPIIDKLVPFVKRSGAKFEATVRHREAHNPAFAFLLPSSPLHPLYKSALVQALGSEVAASKLVAEAIAIAAAKTASSVTQHDAQQGPAAGKSAQRQVVYGPEKKPLVIKANALKTATGKAVKPTVPVSTEQSLEEAVLQASKVMARQAQQQHDGRAARGPPPAPTTDVAAMPATAVEAGASTTGVAASAAADPEQPSAGGDVMDKKQLRRLRAKALLAEKMARQTQADQEERAHAVQLHRHAMLQADAPAEETAHSTPRLPEAPQPGLPTARRPASASAPGFSPAVTAAVHRLVMLRALQEEDPSSLVNLPELPTAADNTQGPYSSSEQNVHDQANQTEAAVAPPSPESGELRAEELEEGELGVSPDQAPPESQAAQCQLADTVVAPVPASASTAPAAADLGGDAAPNQVQAAEQPTPGAADLARRTQAEQGSGVAPPAPLPDGHPVKPVPTEVLDDLEELERRLELASQNAASTVPAPALQPTPDPAAAAQSDGVVAASGGQEDSLSGAAETRAVCRDTGEMGSGSDSESNGKRSKHKERSKKRRKHRSRSRSPDSKRHKRHKHKSGDSKRKHKRSRRDSDTSDSGEQPEAKERRGVAGRSGEGEGVDRQGSHAAGQDAAVESAPGVAGGAGSDALRLRLKSLLGQRLRGI